MKNLILYFFIISIFCACTHPLPLEDLSFINQNLVADISALETSNQREILSLKRMVGKEGNTAEGLDRLKRAEEAALKTKILTDKIDQIKKAIENKKDLSNKNIVYQTFILQKQGKLLENLLQSHIIWLNQKNKDILDAPFEFPYAISQKQDFVKVNFEDVTQIEAMSFLNYLQTQIKRYEGEVLKKLGIGDFSSGFKIYRIFAVAISDANKIQIGLDYESKVFVCCVPNVISSKVLVNQENISFDNDGIRWKSTPSKIGKYPWKAEIQTRKNGKDTTFVLNGTYEVLPKK